MMVFMPLVVVWNGQFCRDVIGRQSLESCSDWSVIVLLLFSIHLLFRLRSCMSGL